VLTDVEFSADGSRIVTSSRDRDARVWDVDTGASTLLRGHFGPVFGAAFSPDGRLVVTAGPTTAGLWQAKDGKLISYLRGHDEPLTSASFSPDGRRILTSSRDGTVRTYMCEVCGGLESLAAVAELRLDALARPLSAAGRVQYVPTGPLARLE
jgi:WD40 repeat protein